MLFSSAKPKLTWYEPRWAYVRRMWWQLRQILNLVSLIRISVATLIVSVVLIAGLKWALPQLALPNLWPMAFALPGLALAVALQLGILTLVPPVITIRADRIVIQHGQTPILIDPKSVTATCLTFHRENRVRLRVRYSTNGKLRSRNIGVQPTVDFERLSALLPIVPMIRDARQRWH